MFDQRCDANAFQHLQCSVESHVMYLAKVSTVKLVNGTQHAAPLQEATQVYSLGLEFAGRGPGSLAVR